MHKEFELLADRYNLDITPAVRGYFANITQMAYDMWLAGRAELDYKIDNDLTICACGDHFTKAEPGKCDTCAHAETAQYAAKFAQLEAEVEHWKIARKSAIDAGELMMAEIVRLKVLLALQGIQS